MKPTILSYQDELNQINNQIHQLEQDKQAESPHYDADMIANVLQAIFKDIDKLEKSQLKSLYLTIIDRIDIRKDEHHKKQFYVTLKLNNEIIKQLFNNHPLEWDRNNISQNLFRCPTARMTRFEKSLIQAHFQISQLLTK